MTAIVEMGKRARAASVELAKLSSEVKNRALIAMADALEDDTEEILKANRIDVEASKAKGVKAALLDRLALNKSRIGDMAECLR